MAVSACAVLAVPTYSIRSVGPTGYGSTMDAMVGDVYGGAAYDLDSGAILPWINANGTAQILPVSTAAYVTHVNAAGQAIGGNTKSTLIGAAGGAVVGGAVGAATAPQRQNCRYQSVNGGTYVAPCSDGYTY